MNGYFRRIHNNVVEVSDDRIIVYIIRKKRFWNIIKSERRIDDEVPTARRII